MRPLMQLAANGCFEPKRPMLDHVQIATFHR